MPNGTDGALRTLAIHASAVLGAVAVSSALVRLLPVSPEWSLALGYHLLVPLWVLLACSLPLLRSGKRAKIQRELHAWTGAAASVVLFVIFYCGVFALFHGELAVWQRPATEPAVTTAQPSKVSYDTLFAQIERDAPLPQGASLTFDLPLAQLVEPGTGTVSVYHEPSGLERHLRVDRSSGEPRRDLSEHSRLSRELHTLHFLYRLPWGIELAGVAAALLFVALASGVAMQWKELLRALRPRLPRSVAETHKALGVLALPLALSYAWSGALLGLLLVLGLPFQHTLFDGDKQAYEAARSHRAAAPVASGRPASRLALDELTRRGVAAATAHFSAPEALRAERLDITLHGEENARFEVRFPIVAFEKRRSVQLGPSGEVLGFVGDTSAPTEAFNRLLFDLHYARAGGLLAKALYALFALAACGVIVSGNLLWLERRDPARIRASSRALERSLLGVCLGLVLASASYFLANRTLPVSVPRRSDVELAMFFAAWLLGAALPFVCRSPRSAAAALCGGAGLCFGAALLVDVVRWPAQLTAALAGGSPEMLVSEALVAALALGCAGLWRALPRGRIAPPPFRPEPVPWRRGSSLQ
jgi:uncharacterized iron-regulated membrane protein